MKTKKMYMAGMLALVLTFGLILAGCDLGGGGGGGSYDPNDPFAGTWESSTFRIVATSGSPGEFKQYMNNKEGVRGTYTYSGNTVTATITEVNTEMFGGTDGWVSWDDLPSNYKQQYIGSQIQTFTISGNSFISHGETFTKQGGSNNNGNNGGSGNFDSDLVAKWHSTQAAADSGTSVAFEFTSDGKWKIAGQDDSTEINVTTSNGRISATMTANGYTVSMGEADYVVDGTTLAFSNFSGSPNYFQNLMTSLQSLSGIGGGDGKFHKKAGGSNDNYPEQPAYPDDEGWGYDDGGDSGGFGDSGGPGWF
ncbi:MAG: hypothetical protein LBG10_05625 [Treponema sp.]|jgi:hypothetical protein|nr:hypothetical protein [Treponema sp.]